MRKITLSRRLLAVTVAVLMGIVGAAAQSTYSWDASQWNFSIGGGTKDGNTITVTSSNWACVQLNNATAFKLPKRNSRLVVKGTNLTVSANNPNIPNLNGTSYQGSFKGSGKFTANEGNTQLEADITSLIKDLDTDFFGNVTISNFGLILDANEGSYPTITSIEFYQPDFIDESTEIAISQSNVANETVTTTTTGNKKCITFTPTATAEFKLEITAPQVINASNAFVVVETSGGITTNTKKFAGITVDGKQKYGYTGGNTGDTKTETIDAVAHTVHVFSVGQCSNDYVTWLAGAAQSDYLTASKVHFYLSATADTETKIHRVGFYNLQEVLTMYPTTIGAMNWRYVNNNQLRIEGFNNGNTVFIKDANSTAPSFNVAKAMFRVLGDLKTKTEINFSNLRFANDVSPTCQTEDIIKQFSNCSGNTLMVEMPTANNGFKYFPTLYQRVVLGNSSYYAYKDGATPTGSSAKQNRGNSISKSYYSYTRQFTEGYNSMTLPFAVNVDDLTALGLTPYTFASCTGSNVTFTKATAGSELAANTPVIVKAAAKGLYLIAANATAASANADLSPNNYYETTESNGVKFVGSFVEEDPRSNFSSYDCYGISADGTKLVKMAGAQTSYYRAFLAVAKSSAGARSLAISFGDGNETTGIKSMNNVQGTMNNEVYDLQGRRVAQPTKGLYIVNGKKVILK